MEKITQLIGSLRKREISAIRKYFKLTRSAESSLKRELFEILVRKTELSDVQIAKLIHKKPNDPSFIMLKKRLNTDILKILVCEEKSKSFLSKFHESKYTSRMMILEAGVLLARGLPTHAEERLQKALKLANQYGLTGDSIIINEELQSLIGLKKGVNTYNVYAENNLSNFDVIKEEFLAQDYFRKLTMPNLFFSSKEKNLIEKSKEATDELKILSEKSKSLQTKYWYLRSSVYYSHLIGAYSDASNSAEKFLELVKESDVFRSKDNLGGAYMQLAIVQIYEGEYLEATENAENAMGYFILNSRNYLNALTCVFNASFLFKDYDKAEHSIVLAKKSNILKSDSWYSALFSYYRANLLFISGKYKDALTILQMQSELLHDKSGWRMGYKILELMCIIEESDFEWLDLRIESFRKLLTDLKKENIARPKIIFQLIKSLIKNGYDLKQTTSDNKEHLDLLVSSAQDFIWDPKGYELIRFDTWWYSLQERKRKII